MTGQAQSSCIDNLIYSGSQKVDEAVITGTDSSPVSQLFLYPRLDLLPANERGRGF